VQIGSTSMIRAVKAVRGALSSKRDTGWTSRFVLFLRIMAWISLLTGLYHWAEVCGIIGQEGGFEAHIQSWQATTIFFAVIDPVAAIGLWLLAPWGAVIWLTSTVAMIVVHVFFDQVYGSDVLVIVSATLAIIAYLILAVLASREQPG
jgi:Family of unknown function (DUF6163)